MPSNTSQADVLALCERLIEGTLTIEDKHRLERLVLDDPDAKRLYVDYMHQHASLRWQAGGVASAPLVDVVALPGRRRWARTVAYAAALPAMVLLGLGLARMNAPKGRAIATLSSAHNARWEGGALPTDIGARLPAGRLRLAEGLATLLFDSGAQVVLEAPAELELVSPMDCVLRRGSLVAHVTPPALGFTVRSATAIVIDHGTEFGVTAGADGATRVAVLSGLVEARHVRTAENLRLTTGETAVFQATRVAARSSFARDPEPATGRDLGAASRGDVVISSAAGRGHATFVHSHGHAEDTAPDGVLLVKNTDQPDWQRKTYVAFDLASLGTGRAVVDASLTLTLTPTGMGHSAFVPDATFAVYGVDEALDDWREQDLSWANAPGNAPGGAGVDGSRVVALGSFVVPQGAAGGAFSVGGRALAEWIARDRNGVVSFLIVRDTPETHGHGLVHGFAGNHHPTGAPPTLRLSLR